MSDSRINKLNILLCIIAIFVTIIVIYNYTYKSTFKLRRGGGPSIYFDGNVYSAYGAVSSPYMLYGNPNSLETPLQNYYKYNAPKAPNADMLLYGQNAPYVMN